MLKFIRNQLTADEICQLRSAWKLSEAATDKWNFSETEHQTDELAKTARDAEDRLHALWRSHGWADQPTWEIGSLLNNEGII